MRRKHLSAKTRAKIGRSLLAFHLRRRAIRAKISAGVKRYWRRVKNARGRFRISTDEARRILKEARERGLSVGFVAREKLRLAEAIRMETRFLDLEGFLEIHRRRGDEISIDTPFYRRPLAKVRSEEEIAEIMAEMRARGDEFFLTKIGDQSHYWRIAESLIILEVGEKRLRVSMSREAKIEKSKKS